MADTEVFKLVVAGGAVLITRDAHFTNAVRFPSEKTGGIIYIRRGNLTAPEKMKKPAASCRVSKFPLP